MAMETVLLPNHSTLFCLEKPEENGKQIDGAYFLHYVKETQRIVEAIADTILAFRGSLEWLVQWSPIDLFSIFFVPSSQTKKDAGETLLHPSISSTHIHNWKLHILSHHSCMPGCPPHWSFLHGTGIPYYTGTPWPCSRSCLSDSPHRLHCCKFRLFFLQSCHSMSLQLSVQIFLPP